MKISKELVKGSTATLVLSVLKSKDMYGYVIIKEIALRSEHVFELKEGTLYPILHALELHEMCVCDLAALLGVTKSAISHQLKALRLSNLVKFRREGQNVYYALADDHVKQILDIGFDHLREE